MLNATPVPTDPLSSILTTDGTLPVQPDLVTGDAFATFLNRSMEGLDPEHPESLPDLTGVLAMAHINQGELAQPLPEPALSEAPSSVTLAAPETFRNWPEAYVGLADPEGSKASPVFDLVGLESTAAAGTAESDPVQTALSTSETRPQPDTSDTDHVAHPTETPDVDNGIVLNRVAGSTNLGSTGFEPVLRSEYSAGEAVIASSGIEHQPATAPAELEAFSTRLTPVSATIDEKIAAVSVQESAPAAITAGHSEPASGVSAFGTGPSSTPSILPSPAATPASVASPASSPPLVATPTQLPEILSQSIGSDEDRRDRIVIQLDPPELGRVSLEFKFDVQGLQTVTVSSETPEAMRRLRLMHFELVQALEQQGLSADNLNYSQQQSRQHAYQPPSRWSIDTPAFPAPDTADRSTTVSDSRNTSRKIDGLDMRV